MIVIKIAITPSLNASNRPLGTAGAYLRGGTTLLPAGAMRQPTAAA
jgi:hypothetical protein